MNKIDYEELLQWLVGQEVERPNAASNGTLSGHAAGEPFEKLVYHHLKEQHSKSIFKQFEFLNDLYRHNPQSITIDDRKDLFDSPVTLFLLSRGDAATRDWNPNSIFEEKQNDTADILYHKEKEFELIDVKTRQITKNAQAPNIISAYKVAQMCALIIDNKEFTNLSIKYVEVDWKIDGKLLKCTGSHLGDLFKADPKTLYINWAAAMQIQFHVSDLDQNFTGGLEQRAKTYLKTFVASAEHRCNYMYEKYVAPFKKYIS